MVNIFYLFLMLWAAGVLKAALFWIYLWQLKEYHIPRFIDHFRTDKGKKILFSPFLAAKLGIFAALLFVPAIAIWAAAAVYGAEIALALARRTIKYPVWTLKTLLLAGASVLLAGAFAFFQNDTRALVAFDLLAPIIFSAVVLAFQPFFVALRYRILKKARRKISSYKNLIVIGITGSYGKTSTKEFLKTILSERFNVLATPQNKNSEMGIAQTILGELHEKHQIFIVEMGSYAKGGIKLLCDIVKPHIGVVTGVNEQHLATFGSMENLLSAEGGRELLESLPSNGTMIFNGDNKYCLDLYKKSKIKKQRIYSTHKHVHADIWAEEISVKKDCIDFVMMAQNRQASHFLVNVLGAHNVQNILAASAAAKELGMNLEEISRAAKNIGPEQAGVALRRGVNNIEIIDSSYSANPNGVKADLEYLKIFSGKKVIVMPCLIELGKKSADVHYGLGKKIAEVCDFAIITTKEKFHELQTGARSRGMKEGDMVFCESPKEISNRIKKFCSSGGAVLLEGRVPRELIKLLHG